MDKLNLLFVLENYLPHLGGVEVVFKNLCEGLVKRGHTVTILTHRLKNTKKEEIMNGVKVRRVRCFDSRYLFSFAAIWQAFKLAKKADIIHTTAFNGAPPGWVAAQLRRKPVIIHVHEIWIGMWQQVTSMSWFPAKIHDLLERMIYFLPYTKYICVSKATQNALIKQKPKKKDKSLVIHNGFDESFFNPQNWDGKKIRKLLNNKEKYMLFSWGRPGEAKGHEFAILAMKNLKEKIPNVQLVLMLGQKEHYKKRFNFLMKTIKDNNLQDVIKVVDSVPYNDLGHYIKAADCIIIPSLSEGFGYTTLQGAQMQKPVIGTNNASIPEVIWGKHLLVPPRNPQAIAEAIIKVHKGKYDTSKRKHFPWKNNISAHEKVYHSLLNRP